MPKYDLKTALANIGQKRLNFSLYRGEEENQILVSAKAPAPKQIAELEETCGAVKRLLKGVCYLEGERLVFASRVQPAPAWEMMLNQILKQRGCAKYTPAALRLLPATEPDEIGEEGETPAAVAPATPAPVAAANGAAAPDPKAKWDRAKRVLLPVIKKVMSVNPAANAKLTPLVAEALQKERASDFAGAINAFERLAPIVKAALAEAPAGTAAAPAPSAPPPPAPPPPSPQPKEIELPPLSPPAPDVTPGRLTRGLNRLTPAIMARLGEVPGRRREIGGLIQRFQTSVRARDLMVAKETLARLGLFVKGA